MTSILIATPCYGGQVCAAFMKSVISLMADGIAKGISIQWMDGSDSLITRARDNLVRRYLDTSYDYLLFVDADIAFKPEQVWRLLDRDVDVAVAAYPFKQIYPIDVRGIDPTRFGNEDIYALQHRFVLNPLKDESIDDKGFIKVYDAATGFMLIKRDVFVKMKEAYPELWYWNDQTGEESENDYLFFSEMIEKMENGKLRRLSEDYAFCRRWQNIGGEIHLDTNSKLTHIGPHWFEGDLKATMKVRTYVAERNRLLESPDL